MALNTLKCNHLASLGLKGLTKLVIITHRQIQRALMTFRKPFWYKDCDQPPPTMTENVNTVARKPISGFQSNVTNISNSLAKTNLLLKVNVVGSKVKVTEYVVQNALLN